MTGQSLLIQGRNGMFEPINPLRMKCHQDFGDGLWNSGIASNALKPGDLLPDFLLPDECGHLVWSQELLIRGPLVMTFFCGAWCSLSVLRIKSLDAAASAYHACGASVVAITPETADLPRKLKKKERLNLRILSDVDYGVGADFGVVFAVPAVMKAELLELGVDLCARHGAAECMLPVPTTYVIGKDGIISAVFVDADFATEGDPDLIMSELIRLGNLPASA
jgi:peroxiredoxin